jgi:hypothetical protein
MPMLASIMFVSVVIDDPHGSLALALSRERFMNALRGRA